MSFGDKTNLMKQALEPTTSKNKMNQLGEEPKRKTTSMTLRTDLLDGIRVYARKNNTSVSRVMENLIIDLLNEE